MAQVPWSLFHARLHRRLRQQSLLPCGAPVLVAVSGGQDSVALLKLLVDLRRQWRWRLTVVHCDHRWRPDSADNAAFVGALCDRWSLPHLLQRAEVPPSSEAAARHWRYDCFEAAALAKDCSHVVTGHTATDRAETLLYNLVRGSGPDGLAALDWRRSLSHTAPQVQLVRPLLEFSRAETGELCEVFQLPIWVDATNCDRTYARNRLRLDVIPYLQTHLNPKVDLTLAQTAAILGAEVDWLEQQTDPLWAQVWATSRPPQEWRLCQEQLQPVHLALQRRLLRRVLRQGVKGQVSFEQVEKLRQLLWAANGSRSDPFPGGAVAVVQAHVVVIRFP